jgi:hypothetical protein
MWALETVLSDDVVNDHVITYVDDLLIHSTSFSDHMEHLDRVFHKLTTARFTINASKCHFCKPEVKFLGHIICDKTVKADPDRIEAILRYPVPRNQKQLRKFLGVCNFHQQFILNYASYVEPLLVLLRKGNKWSWSKALQNAFEILRAKFAESIHLVHPDENKGYIIHTDASGRAIAGVLLQKDDDGHYYIVSTASRVLNAAEQRYSTCECELLAIVYALDRFKVYIYGHKIVLCTDNKSLIFVHKCVITSKRVARWMLNIQECDIEIRHIKGVQNHLADVLSRNPTGLTDEEIRNLTRPDQVMVHSVQLYVDKTIGKELKDLAVLQDTDPRLAAIKKEVTTHPTTTQHRYLLTDNVIYSKGDKDRTRWKAMLPTCIETKIFKFVHYTLGYLGVDKCLEEIRYVFQVRNLGKNLRRFIASCDVYQRVKHPNRSFTIEEMHHFPRGLGDVCAVDIYGSLPVSKRNVQYVFVCYDVFSKFVKLYALKSATTKACLNKLVNQYFGNVVKPNVILPDNGSQFRSSSWRKQLQHYGVDVRCTPIRHPESNPSERCMRELSKFCRIYCNDNHKK